MLRKRMIGEGEEQEEERQKTVRSGPPTRRECGTEREEEREMWVGGRMQGGDRGERGCYVFLARPLGDL